MLPRSIQASFVCRATLCKFVDSHSHLTYKNMAIPWGKGGDFKFYTGSSQNSAWTRDLLHKKNIMDEAKLMGFLPSVKKPNRAPPPVPLPFPQDPLAAQIVEKSPTIDLVPTARSHEPLQAQPTVLSSWSQPASTGSGSAQEQERLRLLNNAKRMYRDRKRMGGKLSIKEQEKWESFIGTLEGKPAKVKEIPPQLQGMSIAQMARAKYTQRGPKVNQRVSAVALARESQAVRDRKIAIGIKKKRTEKNKIRGLDAQQLKLSDRSLSTSALQSSLTMDKYASNPPLKKADWTTHSVASIFQPLDVEKAQLKDSMHSTYDHNFGARVAPKKKLVGGYFVSVDTTEPID
jgi:hypothetical protein